MRKSLKQLFSEEKKPIGMFVNTACPEMVEITAQTGFDFIFIDNEHGSWSERAPDPGGGVLRLYPAGARPQHQRGRYQKEPGSGCGRHRGAGREQRG